MPDIKIALAGNPNSGKTTMFNALTGAKQYVGNWPGVTVERKEGVLKGDKNVLIQDLPGIYSLAPYTLEEVVSRDYLINEQPDVIINVVDGSNLERNLYLTTQLCELGIPVVIALNMIDIVEKRGDKIDKEALGKAFGCKVIETSAARNRGIEEVAKEAIHLAKEKEQQAAVHEFSSETESALELISNIISKNCDEKFLRWYSVKTFEKDAKALEILKLSPAQSEECAKIIEAVELSDDDDSESIITNERYVYISTIVAKSVHRKNTMALSTSDKIDRVLTNRWLAIPIFAVVMYLVYWLSISTIGGWMTDWTNDVLFGDIIPNALGGFLINIGVAPWLYGLIIDGIVAGVGAVLGFLPQMAVLFICLAFLEECGYMSRIAFIMDRIFRRFGLSGKSFIPMLISTGCGVPGIMASRTIENDKDRRMTVMTTTFIPCSAKLPIIALIAGALFGGSALIAVASYFVGIGAIVFSGIVLKKTKLFAGDPAPFVMELPAYHWPRIRSVLGSTWNRLKAFIKKATTIILLATIVIWFLGNFGFVNGQFQMVEDMQGSMLEAVGSFIAPLFAPLGWGLWQPTVATFTGLIAKETVIATFGTLFGGLAEISEAGNEVWPQVAAMFTPVSGFSFLLFNLLCAPCFAAIGAIRREMASAKWTAAALLYQTGLAYAVALIFYQFGALITGEKAFSVGTVVAIVLAAFMIYMVARKGNKSTQDGKTLSVDAVRSVK